MTDGDLKAQLEATFRQAEQDGLRLAIRGRTIALVLIGIWYAASRPSPVAASILAVIAAFGLLGLAHYLLIGTRHDRWWLKYAFITIDIAALAAVIALAPLSPGAEIPQVLTFRSSPFIYFYLVLAVASFSFSPSLVLWSGGVIAGCWWAAFGWVVSDMDRTVTWGTMPQPPTREDYLTVFLDPDFIGSGSRAQETITLVATAIVLAIAVHRARRIVLAQALAEQDRDMISRTFGQYVPQPVAAALIADRGVIAPKEHLATVLFLDVQGFTSIAETTSPNRVIAMLNGFFDAVGAAIAQRNGVVIQFIGDAVMATFNAPLADPEHASNALRAACDIRTLTRTRRFEGFSLAVRIGISTGPIAAGSVGGSGRQAYTVYGDTVNLAARLEVMNKEHGTWLLASEATAQAADLALALRRVGPANIRGKRQPITLYTIEP